MPVSIHGKSYKTVAERVNEFWEQYSPTEWSIITEKLSDEGNVVTFKATIAHLARTVSTGHSDEVRGSTMINKTSALENAETSAVGRALAFMGLGGTEIASADEVAAAIEQQNKPSPKPAIKKTAISLLKSAKTMPALEAAWKRLSAAQHKEIGKDKLTELQDKLRGESDE